MNGFDLVFLEILIITRNIFTPREKSAIRYAEKLAIDYDAIDNDEFFLGLQQHSSDVEIVE